MSALDLTLVSSNLASQCCWSTQNNALGSDHNPCFTILNESPVIENFKKKKFQFNKADWVKYKEIAVDNINEIVVNDNVETFNTNLTSAIIETSKLSIPQSGNKIKQNRKPLPFWNKECREAIYLRNKARNKFNRYKTVANNIEFRKAKYKAQKTLKDAAKSHWEQYCTTLNRNTKLGAVWRMVTG